MESRWGWRLAWAVVIAGNLILVYDWWSSTEQGERVLTDLGERFGAVMDRVKGCEGCARRREAMKRMVNHVHFTAERIVEGEDVPTVPDPVTP
jgi:hypothetical protein